MDLTELKKEQYRLAKRVDLKDGFKEIKTIGGVECVVVEEKLLACIVVCEYPSMKIIEEKSFLLNDPLPYRPGFTAYRELPAMVEAVNMLDQEPDILLVKGAGIVHPRNIGVASHLGLALNLPTIGVTDKLSFGNVNEGKILFKDNHLGFEIVTREHAKPVYVSPGYQVSLATVKYLLPQTIHYPHKMPEPLHLAHKLGKKKAKNHHNLIGCTLKMPEDILHKKEVSLSMLHIDI